MEYFAHTLRVLRFAEDLSEIFRCGVTSKFS